jgi:drug/metabolite transporter (DMT)-like permease
MDTKTKGAGSLLAGAFVVSTFGIWTRFMAPMLNSGAQTAFRCTLAAGLMGLIIWFSRSKKRLRGYSKRQYFLMALLGFLTVVLGLLFIASVTATKVGNTSSLIYAGSIITTFIVGAGFLGEKVTKVGVAAVVLALLGLSMFASDLLSLSLGVLCGLGAGVCDGLCNTVRKKLRGVDRNTAVLYQYIAAALFALPLVFVGGPAIKTISVGATLALLLYTIASVAFAKLLLYGFSHFDISIGGVILAMQIFFGMSLGFIFFAELPSLNELAGSLLIFSAVLMAVKSSVKKSVASSETSRLQTAQKV